MKIEIKVNDHIVGVVENLSIVETRDSSAAAPCGIKFDKIKFSGEAVQEAFSRGFVSKNTQKLPMQIWEYEDNDGNIWKLNNIWLNNIETVYESEGAVVAENVDCEFESLIPR